MKILLVMPCETYGWGLGEHTRAPGYGYSSGILYVSAWLKDRGYSVSCLNLYFHQKRPLIDVMRENVDNIDIVMKGGLVTQLSQCKEILDAAKSVNPELVTVLGGGGITYSPEEAMTICIGADYGVIGEGELVTGKLLDGIEQKEDISKVNNIVYRDVSGKLFYTESCDDVVNINALPMPDYAGFGLYDLMRFFKYAFVVTARSCPFRCTYCTRSGGKKYRQMSLDSVFREIDHIVTNVPELNSIIVTDELFAATENRLLEFCDRIRPYNLRWHMSLRNENRLSLETFFRMKEAGCVSLQCGVESMDDRILKSMKKGITIAGVNAQLDKIAKAGITICYALILGDKEETIETIEISIERYFQRLPVEAAARTGIFMILLYPGSELYDNAVIDGKIKDTVKHITDEIPLVNVSKMNDAEYRFVSDYILPVEKWKVRRIREYSKQRNNHSFYITHIHYTANLLGFTIKCKNCGNESHFSYDIDSEEIDGILYDNHRTVEFWCNECRQEFVAYFELNGKTKKALLTGFDELFKKGNVALYGIDLFFAEHRRFFIEIEKTMKDKYGNIFLLSDNDPRKAGRVEYCGHTVLSSADVFPQCGNIVVPSINHRKIKLCLKSSELPVYDFFEVLFIVQDGNEQGSNSFAMI
jgi:radical SAM superfamily enzyme YgiQ (UPF0313 family)